MFKVRIPADIAYKATPCSESPWGTVDIFNPEIFEWLDERVGMWGWDHDMLSGGDCIVELEDADTAMLLKLMWGGK